MQQKKENLTRKISVRLSPDEYRKIELAFKATTKRKISEYIRYVLLDKPVTVYTRNHSLDTIMAALSLLKSELSAIGNNYNQAVKKLHTMDRIAEIKTWAERSEKSYQVFLEKTAEINQKINQLFDQWLQE